MAKNYTSVTQQVWNRIARTPDAAFSLEAHAEAYTINANQVRTPGGTALKKQMREGTITVNWAEFGHFVAEATLYLRNQGLKRGDRIAILGWDSLHWAALDRASEGLGLIVVPPHPNSTRDQVAHVLNDAQPTVLIVESAKMQEELVDLSMHTRVRLDGENVAEDQTNLEPLHTALFGDVFQHCPDMKGSDKSRFRDEAATEFDRLKTLFTTPGAELPFQMDDVCTLIYTSGSTGLPKGVKHTHKTIAAICSLLVKQIHFNGKHVLLHFLPFSHIYGKVNGLALAQVLGVVSAFGQASNLKNLLTTYRPNLILGVPLIWNRLMSEIENKAKSNKMLAWGMAQSYKPVNSFASFCDRMKYYTAAAVIYPKIRKEIGMDHIDMIVSGSAAIPIETTKKFAKIKVALREGYGASETGGGFALNTLDDYVYASLGKCGEGAEIRLVADPGMPPNTGWIEVRGDFVFTGYWRAPEKTAESFTADGFYKLGDTVRIDENGRLWFEGRGAIKKTGAGEFYSEERVQTALEANALIAAAVPTGEGFPCIGSLIFLDPLTCKRIAGPAPDGVNALEYWANNDEIKAAVKAAVTDGNAALLAGPNALAWEQVRKWIIVPEELTVENGMRTNTLKPKNKVVRTAYEAAVKAMYAAGRS